MPKKLQSRLLRWVLKHYDDHVVGAGTDGTWEARWLNLMTKDGVQMLLDTGQQREVLEELLAALGENVWHRDPPPQQFELFSVGGVEVLPSYTFTDKAVPGGFRRVSSRWATPRQVTRDALVADVKANEAVLAATRKRENAARIEGRVGDTDALLWDHRDGIVGLAA